jgi:uncharacterized protein YjbI with pentapeptide repeats
MRDEVERILKMVEEGVLTSAQASDMIAALSAGVEQAATGSQEAPTGAQQALRGAQQPRTDTQKGTQSEGEPNGAQHRAGEQDSQEPGGRRRRHQRRGRGGSRRRRGAEASLEGMIEDIGEEIQHAVDLGTKAVRRAIKDTVSPEGWGDTSNAATFAKAEEPSGEDFRCEGNQLTLAQLRGLRLHRSEFCNNELNAAGVAELDVSDGAFNDNTLRGSSLNRALIEQSVVASNQFNGVALSRLTLAGSRLEQTIFNGVQIKELALAESIVRGCRLNGVKLKSVVFKADTHLHDVAFKGVMGRHWLCEGANLANVAFTGLRIDGLSLEHAGLENCSMKTQDWSGPFERGDLLLVRKLKLERVVLRDCHFVDCTLDDTTLHNFHAEGLHFEAVDFTGMTISSAAELAALAGSRDVA